MADINVNFKHPTNGRVISVTVDETMTGQEAIGELIASDFIQTSPHGYELNLKQPHDKAITLDMSKSLRENNVKENDTLQVIPLTDAGKNSSR